jgi:hypothetical protein
MTNDPRTRDDLLEAMDKRACPLCVLVERIERKAVDLFLYDQVNDISRRDALRASRGLCLQHTAMLAEGRSALGVAIVSRDVLRAMTAELEKEANHKERKEVEDEQASQPFAFLASFAVKVGAKLAARVAPQAGCPMCDERPRVEAPLIAGLLRNFGDAAFAAAFEACGGLCRVHLVNTLRVADSATARALAGRQAAAWRRLEAELDEFIRKHDYRFQGEVLDAERDVWRRALRLTSGWYEE